MTNETKETMKEDLMNKDEDDAMRTVELKIEGMTCEHCARSVTKALNGVDGVERAEVDYVGGRGTIRLRGGTGVTAALKAVEGAGYRAEEASGTPGVAPLADTPVAADPRPGSGNDVGPVGGSDVDLLVIGSGSAGMAAAIRGAELGRSVVVVESGTLGGTCVNVGCIPSKNLIAAADHLHRARAGSPGIATCDPKVDWREVVETKRTLVDHLRQAKYQDVLDAYPEIGLVRGRARFVEGGGIEVDGERVRTERVVIATGTSPWMTSIPGLDEVEPLNSATAMELDEVPKSLVILGAGAVGLELGQTFARFGSRVTVLEMMPEILPEEDSSAAEALRTALEDEGIEIHIGARTTRVERKGGGVLLEVEMAGRTRTFRAERLLVATGRRANTAELGLEEAGVETDDKGFVRVDAGMRTNAPSVFAAGEVAGLPGFVYVAAAAGRVAASNALEGGSEELDLRAVPRVVFTSPQLAAVGLNEKEAAAEGLLTEVGTLELPHLPRAAVEHTEAGWVRVVAESGSGRILGLQAVAPNAAELLGSATLAIRKGLTVEDVVETLHPYLTWVEGFKLAAQTVSQDVSKLSCCA